MAFSRGHFGSEAIKSVFDSSRVNAGASCDLTAAQNSVSSILCKKRRVEDYIRPLDEIRIQPLRNSPHSKLPAHFLPSMK